MGCAVSSNSGNTSNSTRHHYNRRQNANTTTTTTTTTTTGYDDPTPSKDTGGNKTTDTDNTQTKTATLYPDDNAIYGFDLYGDDDKKKEGNTANETQHDTNNDDANDDANNTQYDDAGFYGETEKEKGEQELFDGQQGQTEEQHAGGTERDGESGPVASEEVPTDTDTKTQEEVPTDTDTKTQEEVPTDTDTKTQEEVPTDTDTKTQEEPDIPPPHPSAEEDTTAQDGAETKEDEAPHPPAEDAAKEETGEKNDEEIPPPPTVDPPNDDVQQNDEEHATETAKEETNDVVADTFVNEIVDSRRNEAASDDGYTENSVGLLVKDRDFRTRPDEDRQERRPQTASGQLWEDHDFGLYQAVTDPSVNHKLTWKRPSEISDNPQLFSDGTTRFDIGQGGAGTCWFLSTVANISEQPELLKKVIPDDAYPVGTAEYDGIFHARFWRFGQWDDVYIDDFLPIIHDNTPWGARSDTDKNEFWVSFLEKAFARYHGSYNLVYGGQPGDAYLALTGGVAERIDFEDNEHKPNKFFRRVRNAINSGALVTCTVPGQYDNFYGLVGDHAYSVTGTAKVQDVSLLRVRNPWGNTEWKGAWSDGSGEWTGIVEAELCQVNKDDGEFWISLQDFITYFSQTTICSLTPDFDMDGRSDSLNYVTNIYGEWLGETAAGFQNKLNGPRFMFTVPESETEAAVVVQLIQRKDDRKDENFQVRCDLYKVLCENDGTAVLEIMGENTNNYSPETQCSFRHLVTAGTYAVIPSTAEAGLEKSFLIRLFSSCPLNNVREHPKHHKVMSSEAETIFSHDGEKYYLGFCRTVLGAWKAGVNAGGQISNRDTHASNPQFVISVDERTPVVIHILQEHCNPKMPVGLRLYPTGDAPMNIDQIYAVYESAVRDTDGTQFKFIQSWDVSTAYMLNPGQYTLLIHMDEPDTEKGFAFVVKSTHRVDIREFQTGV